MMVVVRMVSDQELLAKHVLEVHFAKDYIGVVLVRVLLRT